MANRIMVNMMHGEIMNPAELRKFFAGLKDGQHVITATYQSGRRSSDQNAYFHGVICPMVREGLINVGWEGINDDEDAKDFLKEIFLLRKTENPKTGEERMKVLRTSELTKLEFSEFIEQIIKWGAEYLGIQIPYPGEYR